MKGLSILLAMLASSAAPLAAPASAPTGTAAAACEEAALKTLRENRGASVSAVFDRAPVRVPGAADAGDVTLRGSGTVRSGTGAQAFSYSCTIDTRSNEVAGVVLRGAAAPERSATARAVEPDLSQLSPVACESAAAVALKQRWPAVTRIAFSEGTRTLAQDSSGLADLRGQGTAQPAPNAPATHFSYQCALDARSGRVLTARIAD
jgi:FlaG/FlaF family flagellin (archaellin)